MRTQDALAEAAIACKAALTRFLPGFTEANGAAQTEHLPNHVLWTLGHVAFYLHTAAGRLDGQPTPESDFGPDVGRRARYVSDSIGFGSSPTADAERYPSLARGVQIFEAACDRLARAVRRADDAALEKQVDWVGTQVPLALLIFRVLFHAGVHTGQILDLRRGLGLGRVLG